jgi:hypothetical protein
MASLVGAHGSGGVRLGLFTFSLVGVYVHPGALGTGFEHDLFKTEQAFLGSRIPWHIPSY